MSHGDNRFGNLLRACRHSAGLSQEELAARSRLSVRTLRNLEGGDTRWPYRGTVLRLADALELRDAVRAEFIGAANRRLVAVADAAGIPLAGIGSADIDRRQLVPRQLPASVRQFVAREAELAELDRLLEYTQVDGPAAVVISAIEGTAGVGKTALAVHWAHLVAEQFPDGQIYMNLRGFDPSGEPVPPAAAIRDILTSLDVPADRIPASLHAQAALYRSLLAGKRMLMVLDNARNAQQVRPLLPGGPDSMVVVTSRTQLTGLAATEGASVLSLDLLTETEALRLLELRLGADRLGAEPAAAAELVRLCSRLPSALAIAAARVSARPRFGVKILVEELKEARNRLDALEVEGDSVSVRKMFSWSLSGLSAQAAAMFGLLGLHPGPEITGQDAASLAGISRPLASSALRELARTSLVTEHAPGRYSLHDLLRTYAAETAAYPGSAVSK